MMAHADETDDSHNESRSHPGCADVPAALAAGEVYGIDGAGLLRAVTLGYDIGTRVVLAMGGAAFSYESSLRPTALLERLAPPPRLPVPLDLMPGRCAGRLTMPRRNPQG